MDTNILVALAPVIVAIGGGLAFLAYVHPREYRVLTVIILGGLILLMVGGIVWNQSYSETYLAVLRSHVVPSDKLDQLTAATDALALPWWWFPALFVGWLYVSFLSSLSLWIPDVAKRVQPAQSDLEKKE
jgi:hypothetical protein